MKTYIKWMVGPAAVAALAGGMLVNGGQGIGEVPLTHAAGQGLVTSGLTDLNGHWAKAGIEQALAKGYVDGYEDGSFQPDRQVSRAEFAKMAVAAMKLPVSGSSSGSDWYMGAVNAAVNAGVHKWSDFSTGDWNTPMNRAEMARMAVRAAGQDTDDELKWMYLATKAGLIQGVDDTGSLEVDGTTTRAQAVTIIERILAVKDGREGEIAAQADKHAVNRAEVLWHKTNIETMWDGEYINVAATPESDRIDPTRLYASHDNGNVKGWTEGLYVVDLDDPNDPYKHLLERAKVYYTDRIDGKPIEENNPLPDGGAYVLLSVNNVLITEDTQGLGRFNNAAMLEGWHRFDYAGEFMGRAASSYSVNFYFKNGKRELAQGTRYTLGEVYIARNGTIYPKNEGTSKQGRTFDFTFRSFGEFSDRSTYEFKYRLADKRISR